ncbi:hypothetical protein [Bacteroides sp.]
MKQSLVSVLLLATLAGCTQGELPEGRTPLNEDLVEIRLKSVAGPLEAHTRAPFIGEIGADNQLTAKVLLSKTAGGFVSGGTITPGKMVFAANRANTELWNTKNYYPADDSPVFLCGLHPDDTDAATKWAEGTDGSTMTYVFDGKTDVMAAGKVESKKSEAQSGTYKELAFKHLLTNLIIKAEADLTGGMTLAQVQAAWGDITSIGLIRVNGTAGPKNKVTVTLNDATAATSSAFSADGTYGVGFYRMSGKNFPKTGVTTDLFSFTDDAFSSTAIPSVSEAVAYSMVVPIVSADGTDDFTLLVKTTNSVSAGIEVPVNLKTAGDTQGQYCIVTLKFRNTTIHASASVADWTEGGTADEIVQ